MKVRATSKYKEKGLKAKELGRIPNEGEEFDVSVEKFDILNGNNEFNAVFVTKLEDEIIEKATNLNEENIENKEELSTEPTQNVEKPKDNNKKNNTKKK